MTCYATAGVAPQLANRSVLLALDKLDVDGRE